MKKRRTNWDRVDELNAIIKPITEKHGLYFAVLRNAREFTHPYALCYKTSPELSRDFRSLKAAALRMRAAHERGGDKFAVHEAAFNA